MAKYKANIKFHGLEENKTFEAGEEFEMTVKRADEIQDIISEKYNDKYGIVLERIDNKKATNNVVKDEIDEQVEVELRLEDEEEVDDEGEDI